MEYHGKGQENNDDYTIFVVKLRLICILCQLCANKYLKLTSATNSFGVNFDFITF